MAVKVRPHWLLYFFMLRLCFFCIFTRLFFLHFFTLLENSLTTRHKNFLIHPLLFLSIFSSIGHKEADSFLHSFSYLVRPFCGDGGGGGVEGSSDLCDPNKA